ncbi:MAG: aminocarboxymuconate-semialdehyde decarboxylase [Bradyrhizobium sp.]|jgi:2,3-dihydroxybenzoate decarboxylase|nr:aminocarboxymuconate-semialdehyde decarboxylase [Bradyrhizobium sp.]
MIIDFEHHFTPREFVSGEVGPEPRTQFDENGAPSYTFHSMLYDLDEHIRMMDIAGIDAALLTSAAGMVPDIERCRKVNEATKKAEKDYPGRFIGCAHIDPVGGPEHFKELSRCFDELDFHGAIIASEVNGLFIDSPRYEPFWAEMAKLGQFVFLHPALKLNDSRQFDGYDMSRSVGREFSLIMALIRMINSGVFDRHPTLTVHISHLGGNVASLLGRIRMYQDKEYWGTVGNERHGRKAEKPFDYYLTRNFVYNTAGIGGAMKPLKAALVEFPADRIVFATDYPQEVRDPNNVKTFIGNLRAMGDDGRKILTDNISLLIKKR